MKIMKKSSTSKSQSETEIALKESEQRYRTTMMSVGDGVIATDIEGRVEMMNPVAEELTGWKKEEATGKSLEEIFNIINEETRQTVENPVRHVMREGIVVGLANHSVLIAKDGTEHPIADSGAPIRNEKGEITGVVLVFRDQTQEREAQKALYESEARLHMLIEGVTDYAIYLLDPGGKVVNWNSGAERLNGYRADEIIGQTFSQFFTQDDQQNGKPQRLLAEAQLRGPIEDEGWRVRKDGTRFWASAVITALQKEDGSLYGFAKVTRDLTERKRVEETLQETSEALARIVETSPLSIIVSDLQGDVTMWNHAAETTFGWKANEVIGNPNPIILSDKQDEVRGVRQQIIEGRSLIESETERVRKDGVLIAVSLSATALRNKEGQPNGILSIIADITKRKQAEKEVSSLNTQLEQRVIERTAQLEAANKELEAFAYSVSHDLRAPLRAVDGFSRFIMEDYGDKLDSEGKRMLGLIRSNTQKMDQLITDLLGLSQITRKDLRYSDIDMTQMAISMFNETAQDDIKDNIRFTVDQLPEAFADPTFLKQVWINLLSNAIKFTSKKKIPEIKIGSKIENHTNTYYIKDNGVGFNQEYVHKLFGVFQRLHKSEDFEGTGVGLAIVQRIIHRLGGKVWAESEEGKGATFYFSLPVKK